MMNRTQRPHPHHQASLDWAAQRSITPIVVSDVEAVGAAYAFGVDHRVLVEPSCGAALAATEVCKNCRHPPYYRFRVSEATLHVSYIHSRLFVILMRTTQMWPRSIAGRATPTSPRRVPSSSSLAAAIWRLLL